MSQRIFALCLTLLAALFCWQNTQADDRLKSTLIFATNESGGKVESEICPYATDILNIFHYNTFHLVGRSSQVIEDQPKGVLKPGSAFYVRYEVLKRLPAHYQVHIDLLENPGTMEKLLASAELRIAKEAPIYIKGPLWRSGSLILVLEID